MKGEQYQIQRHGFLQNAEFVDEKRPVEQIQSSGEERRRFVAAAEFECHIRTQHRPQNAEKSLYGDHSRHEVAVSVQRPPRRDESPVRREEETVPFRAPFAETQQRRHVQPGDEVVEPERRGVPHHELHRLDAESRDGDDKQCFFTAHEHNAIK